MKTPLLLEEEEDNGGIDVNKGSILMAGTDFNPAAAVVVVVVVGCVVDDDGFVEVLLKGKAGEGGPCWWRCRRCGAMELAGGGGGGGKVENSKSSKEVSM